MSEIRKDFAKACLDEANRACKANEVMDIPLFAAKWMAERCADSILSVPDRLIIRQLAKELDHE